MTAQLDGLIRQFRHMSEKVFSKELRELEYLSVCHRKGSMSFSVYWPDLHRLAASSGVSTKGLPDVDNLVKAISYEKAIDFAKADAERKALIDLLSKRLGQVDLEELVLKSLDFKKKKISQAQFHVYLADLAKKPNGRIGEHA